MIEIFSNPNLILRDAKFNIFIVISWNEKSIPINTKNQFKNQFAFHSLEIFVFFIGEGCVFDLFPFVGQLLNLVLIHLNFNRLQGQSLDQIQVRVSDQSSQNPKEWLFVLIVRFCRNIKILKVSFSVESNLSGFHFSVLLVDFVTN